MVLVLKQLFPLGRPDDYRHSSKHHRDHHIEHENRPARHDQVLLDKLHSKVNTRYLDHVIRLSNDFLKVLQIKLVFDLVVLSKDLVELLVTGVLGSVPVLGVVA